MAYIQTAQEGKEQGSNLKTLFPTKLAFKYKGKIKIFWINKNVISFTEVHCINFY